MNHVYKELRASLDTRAVINRCNQIGPNNAVEVVIMVSSSNSNSQEEGISIPNQDLCLQQ